MSPALLVLLSMHLQDFPVLTLSMPGCHLKTTNKSVKFEILLTFVFFSALTSEWTCIKRNNIESGLLQDGKIYSFSRCECNFQRENFTDWRGERVNSVNSNTSQTSEDWCHNEKKQKTKKQNVIHAPNRLFGALQASKSRCLWFSTVMEKTRID